VSAAVVALSEAKGLHVAVAVSEAKLLHAG
jgi:hypothetical protein